MKDVEYGRMFDVEDHHWWYLGMETITRAILDRHLPPAASRQILDAGCGTGAAMANYLPDYGTVTGLDISPLALGLCRVRKLHRLARASVMEIPFAGGSFDVVASFDVMVIVDRDVRTVEEFYRVLRPGGHLLLRVAAYDWLVASGIEPGRIVVAGDSAGGNLALALLLRLRDAGTPLPAGAVLLSPVTDLRLSGASHTTRKAVDPFFAKADLRAFIELYAGSHDLRDPYLSPLGAELGGLPPLLLHVGDHEVLRDDAVGLGERARAAGVEARTVVWPGMTHVFQVQTFLLPEARRANAEIGAFIRARVGVSG